MQAERDEPLTRAERRALEAALADVTGTDRVLLYDVALDERPHLEVGRLRPQGSPAWERFLVDREHLDDGRLGLVVTRRQLDDDEARLAVEWGCSYANTFLLVEPTDARCDLLDATNPWGGQLRALVSDAGGRASMALRTFLGTAIGRWVRWTAPPPDGEVERVVLTPTPPGAHVVEQLVRECERRYPQAVFDHEIVRLHLLEAELVSGPVSRARSVFRTRLGMPVLLDPFASDRGIRRLVERGRLSVSAKRGARREVFGPGRPLPGGVTDEEFATYVVD
ncbi:MAG: hypothetical protein U0360_07370 [Dehalococcoidia bacterium]